MRQLRYALSRWLVAMGTWALLHLAPRPRAEDLPLDDKWLVRRDDVPNARCWILFSPADVMPVVVYHVWVLWETSGGRLLAFDGGTKELVYELPEKTTLKVMHRAMRVQYCVEVHFEAGSRQTIPDDSIGPMTCVTLAKRVAGVEDSSIHTPEQLLAGLWRNRDGRSS